MKFGYVNRMMAGIGIVATFAGSHLARAQQTLASAPVSTEVAAPAFGRPVTVRIDRQPLKQAVSLLAEQSKVRMQFQDEVLDAVTTPVTLHATNMPLGEALRRLFAGTSLRATAIAHDYLSIESVVHAAPAAQGVIVGRVVNAASRQGVAGARITVDGSTVATVTDENGVYRLTVASGQHTLHVRAVGHGRETRRIVVTDEQTTTADFTLQSTASVLDEVVVTSAVVATERKAIPTPITVITAEEIEKRGITRVEQLLRGEVPGVIAIESGSLNYQAGTVPNVSFGYMTSSSVYTRGSAGLGNSNGGGTESPLKTYVDGVEILSPSYLGTIDPASIERIEIVTGPQASTIYGSEAIGGVMQIFTKKGTGRTSPDFTLSARFGFLESNLSSGKTPTHNHTLSMAGGSGPEFSYSGTLSYTYSGQWQPNLFARRYGASLGATHTRGPVTVTGTVATTAAVNGTTSSPAVLTRVYRETGEWLAPNGTGDFNAKRTNESSTQTLSLRADYRPLSWWQHQLTLGRSQTDLAINPDAPRFFSPADTLWGGGTRTGSRTSWSYNTTAITRLTPYLSSTLTVGGDGSNGRATQASGCRVSPSATSYVGCTSTGAPFVSKPLDDERWGLFGRGQIGFWDQVFVTGGLRGEHNPNYGRAHKVDWTPTIGLTYTVVRGDVTLKLLGAYGRATRPPNATYRDQQFSVCTFCDPRDYLGRLASPDLRPEYSRGPQGGFELYYGNLGSLTINRYRQKITDLIELVVVDSVLLQRMTTPVGPYYVLQRQYLNTAGVNQQGWEGTGSLNLRPFTVKGTWSWNDSRVAYVVDPDRGFGLIAPGNVFNGIPSHTANVTASYAAGNTSITVVTNYVGPTLQVFSQSLRYVQNSSVRLKTYIDNYRIPQEQWRKAGYVKSDVALSHRVTPWASAIVNIVNVGNGYGTDVNPLYPALGRQTSFGFTLRSARGR